MAHQSRIAGYTGIIAAASLAFTPAQAQAAEVAPIGTAGFATDIIAQSQSSTALQGPLGSTATPSLDEASEYYGYRWGRWRGRGWRGHRRGIRGGDILAGVLVLGGIAAIASAAKNERRRDREVVVVERNRVRDNDYNYRPENRRSTTRSTNGGSGIDNAVSMCLNEVEQNIRVDSVDGASRVGSGWIVTGSLFDGSGFSCQIDNSGRISNVDYGRGVSTSSAGSPQTFARAEGQWSDDRYSNARADVGGGTRPDLAINPDDTQLPAYPGGPLPGEEASER